jgi:glyoxylase-like metal-dependent hydrolase (beta-lactamase superfamily II)
LPSGLPDSLADSTLTHKQLGIGQRAILLETDGGNVLWDLVALLDDDTVDFINSKGGLKAIIISHPHYYTTHIDWAKEFKCPVYVSKDDEEWLCRDDEEGVRKWVKSVDEIEEVNGAVTAVQCGGHFDGSLVLLWGKKMFIADTIMHVPVCVCVPTFAYSHHVVWRGSLTICSQDFITKTVYQALSATRFSGRIRTVSISPSLAILRLD